MTKQPPSIFNDVIGPVMRGPSSSHTAAAARIGLLARQMVCGRLTEVAVEFHPEGSLATTYHGQGSDIGLVGGLLGYTTRDDRLPRSLEMALQEGLDVSFRVVDYAAAHPNTYRMTLKSDRGETVSATAISTGGGMIRYEEVSGFPVNICGDFFETLVFCADSAVFDKVRSHLEQRLPYEHLDEVCKGQARLAVIKTTSAVPADVVNIVSGIAGVGPVLCLSPVLPVLSSKDVRVPFLSAAEMSARCGGERTLHEMALLYESCRGRVSEGAVMAMMDDLVSLLRASIGQGLAGTEYTDRILGRQSHLIPAAAQQGKVIPGDALNRVISYITALMEVKSAMGVIIAAPTAGSCGALPGTILGVCDTLGLPPEDATRAMLAAGVVGVFIAEHATFAAEVGGCQVECGAGSAMAAAGLVDLMGGTAKQAIDAAAMALQNVMGMICDPVADRVEVPCLGKNVMAGANAIACATMALAGFDKVIPLDETIDAMYRVGQQLPAELRCTGKGGLSITPTGQKIHAALQS